MLFVQILAPEMEVKAHASYTIVALNPKGPSVHKLQHVDGTELERRDSSSLSEGLAVEKWPLVGVMLKEPLRGGGNARNASAMLAAWGSKQV
jgi:hypothetical protein